MGTILWNIFSMTKIYKVIYEEVLWNHWYSNDNNDIKSILRAQVWKEFTLNEDADKNTQNTCVFWIEWVAIPFSRGSSWPRDWTQVSCIAGGFLTIWATREAPKVERRQKTLSFTVSPKLAMRNSYLSRIPRRSGHRRSLCVQSDTSATVD